MHADLRERLQDLGIGITSDLLCSRLATPAKEIQQSRNTASNKGVFDFDESDDLMSASVAADSRIEHRGAGSPKDAGAASAVASVDTGSIDDLFLQLDDLDARSKALQREGASLGKKDSGQKQSHAEKTRANSNEPMAPSQKKSTSGACAGSQEPAHGLCSLAKSVRGAARANSEELGPTNPPERSKVPGGLRANSQEPRPVPQESIGKHIAQRHPLEGCALGSHGNTSDFQRTGMRGRKDRPPLPPAHGPDKSLMMTAGKANVPATPASARGQRPFTNTPLPPLMKASASAPGCLEGGSWVPSDSPH